jgi:hypothetical protein
VEAVHRIRTLTQDSAAGWLTKYEESLQEGGVSKLEQWPWQCREAVEPEMEGGVLWEGCKGGKDKGGKDKEAESNERVLTNSRLGDWAVGRMRQ